MSDTTESITETLAIFSAELKYDDLSNDVIQEIKRLLLDTLGCGLGGLHLEKGEMALRLARQSGGVPEASVFGTADRYPAAMAAFVNGELMNALDWCALQPPAHVAPYVIPSVLALAELRRTTGKEVIASLAVALELSCRVADSLGNLRAKTGGFPVRSYGMGCNQLGATAGAARVLGLDRQRMRHALGLGGYFAPIASHGKYSHTVHVGYAKYGPSGWTAQGGVVTAQLAEIGYRGDGTVMDGEYGFWAMNGSQSFDPPKLTRAIGREWAFLALGYKYWPCCGSHQSPLDAFSKIIEDKNLQPQEIESVIVQMEEYIGLPKYVSTDIQDHVEAASSLPYNIAVAAHRVPWGPKWQSRETMADHNIREFMKRVTHGVYPRSEEMRHQDLVIDGRRNLKHRPARVEVHARGQIFAHAVDFAKWLTNDVEECRASNEELADKFHANAEGVLSRQVADQVIDRVMNLDRTDDVAVLAKLLLTSR